MVREFEKYRTFFPIWAMMLRFCSHGKKRKKENGAKDCTEIKHEQGTREIENISMCPEKLFWSQLTCPYMTLGMRYHLWLPLFSSSLLLSLQYFLIFHFFFWPSKHFKFGIGNNRFWLFYFRTKFIVNVRSYFAKIAPAYTLKTKKWFRTKTNTGSSAKRIMRNSFKQSISF